MDIPAELAAREGAGLLKPPGELRAHPHTRFPENSGCAWTEGTKLVARGPDREIANLDKLLLPLLRAFRRALNSIHTFNNRKPASNSTYGRLLDL